MGKFIDLTGRRVGKLTVLRPLHKNKWGDTIWECQCDCGNIHNVDGISLRGESVKSCGCSKREFLKAVPHAPFKDETGNIYGSLKALKRVGSDPKGHALWLCQCICGQQTIVTGDNLRGGTSSCGCQKASKGEIKIFNLLSKYGIPFTYENRGFKISGSKQPTRFDFYVDNSYFIEHDGEIHYINTCSDWWEENQFKQGQERDKLKTQWCLDNNITLIRIPYTKYKSLKIQDLLNIEGNPFIVVDAKSYKEFELKEVKSPNQLPQKKYIISKNILQYDLNGNFIKEWDSIENILKEIDSDNHYNIIDVCNGKGKSFKGFQWRWKGDDLPILKLNRTNILTIYKAYDKVSYQKVLELNRKELKEQFPTYDLATIDGVCKRKKSQLSYKGYIWRYSFDCLDME